MTGRHSWCVSGPCWEWGHCSEWVTPSPQPLPSWSFHSDWVKGSTHCRPALWMAWGIRWDILSLWEGQGKWSRWQGPAQSCGRREQTRQRSLWGCVCRQGPIQEDRSSGASFSSFYALGTSLGIPRNEKPGLRRKTQTHSFCQLPRENSVCLETQFRKKWTPADQGTLVSTLNNYYPEQESVVNRGQFRAGTIRAWVGARPHF